MKTARFKPLGVITDIPAQEVEADNWSRVVNAVFQDDACKLAAGYRDMAGTLLFPPAYLIPNQQPSVFFWVYPSQAGIGAFDGANHFDITPALYTGAGPGYWTAQNLNNLPIINNSIDPPLYWNGNPANICLPMPGWPAGTTAGWMRSFKYMAIAGDIKGPAGDFENQVLWSEAVDPGQVPQSWTAAPDNAAGDNILAATPGSVVDGVALRDNFVLLKNHSMYLMSLVGGQFIFSFRKLFITTGVLTRNCAKEYKGKLFVFTDGDVIMTDGHDIVSIAERKVRRTIFNEMSADYYQTSFMAIWPAEDELWCCYPTAGATVPNKAAVYNLITGHWGFRELPNVAFAQTGLITDDAAPRTWATMNEQWKAITWRWDETGLRAIADSLIMATPSPPQILAVGEIDDTDPVIIQGIIAKDSFPLEDWDNVKTITEIWPILVGQRGGQINVRVGSQMRENDPITWGPSKPFVFGSGEKLSVNATGRLFSVQYSGEGVGGRTARISGFELRYRTGGRY